MNNIFVFSQHLQIETFSLLITLTNSGDNNVFITTHYLFENEKKYLLELFGNCEFKTFADYLTDKEMADCDHNAYSYEYIDYNLYLYRIRKNKNAIVIKKILKEYRPCKKYILSNDLGICYPEWKRYGFKFIKGEYYYETNQDVDYRLSLRNTLSKFPFFAKVYNLIRNSKQNKLTLNSGEVFVSTFESQKYVFIGKLSRLDYRLSISFLPSVEEANRLNSGIFETKDKCTYLTTWHEHSKCIIPDKECYKVRWAQDGYLPPNYSHMDYHFKPSNVVYYCWDKLGTQLFKNQRLPYELIPFRKKLYLPNPIFKDKIKTVLIVASGSGDWTALKNRSDDDLLVDVFSRIATEFPDIQFIYRCHPTWISPQNVGVNSINRVSKFFSSLGINNILVSTNIPMANQEGRFQLTFSRTSLEEDLKSADFVFGEHSISMIDAAFQRIPFASVNMTNRRNFFKGITDLGFPHCKDYDDIVRIISNQHNTVFQQDYNNAINNYNSMTDDE